MVIAEGGGKPKAKKTKKNKPVHTKEPQKFPHHSFSPPLVVAELSNKFHKKCFVESMTVD